MKKHNKKTTKKYVLTGGPGIGKTTLLDILEIQGYTTVPEAARQIIEEQQEVGGEALPWKDNGAFQLLVMKRQLFLEKGLPDGAAFLDRGLVDGAGYCAYFGAETPEGLQELGEKRYEKVFILERLPVYEKDAARLEDSQEAEEIHQAVTSAYLHYGYDPIIVPVLLPTERVKFILDRL